MSNSRAKGLNPQTQLSTGRTPLSSDQNLTLNVQYSW